MADNYQCLHWVVCVKTCPAIPSKCRHYVEGPLLATWLHSSTGNVYCSNCNLTSNKESKYCPNCGAKMGG